MLSRPAPFALSLSKGERGVFPQPARRLCALSLSPVRIFPHLGAQLLRGGLLLYHRILSPLLGPACRFYPSCSCYALAAIEKYGVIKGTGLSLLRLAKCHPWHPGGVDPLR